MPRKLAALLPALALALCYAHAGSWASVAKGGDAHACCRHGAPAKAEAPTDCCVTPAAAGAVHVVRVDAPAVLAALPALHAAPIFFAFVPQAAAPRRAGVDRAAAPARAPPLA
jgi:hypothetical protein